MPIIKNYIVPHPPLIIPEIGKGEIKKIRKTVDAYHKIAKDIAKIHPDTIIISSPHSTMYADYFHISPQKSAFGDFSRFGAEEVKVEVEYDTNLRQTIVDTCQENGIRAGLVGEKDPELDHGTLIPLYFIQQYLTDFKTIRISPSGMSIYDHYNLGALIGAIVKEGKRVVWVASGDLSHKLKEDGPYGLSKEGIEFDHLIQEIISSNDYDKLLKLNEEFCYKAAECGLGSIAMMLGTLDGANVESKILSYENTFGVGYLVAELTPLDENPQRHFGSKYVDEFYHRIKSKRDTEDEYVRLARNSLEYYIRNRKKMTLPKDLIPELYDNKAGVFVSLHIDGKLRGCIGTILPTTNSIAEEIIRNAISAGVNDYRFSEVKESELEVIDYSVDVLFPPEAIKSMQDLDIVRYGVIVKSGYKSGLLLPNIDGINSVAEQVRIAKQKAGISEDEPFTMERFEVIRHY